MRHHRILDSIMIIRCITELVGQHAWVSLHAARSSSAYSFLIWLTIIYVCNGRFKYSVAAGMPLPFSTIWTRVRVRANIA